MVSEVSEDGVAQVEGVEVEGLEVVEETDWGLGAWDEHEQRVISAQHLRDLGCEGLYS